MNIEQHRDDQFDSCNPDEMLRSVEINPTELCNRTCVFCPRADPEIYPNRKKFIDNDTVKNLCHGLNEIEYTNRVGFVGFGEPLLHPDIYTCISIVRKILPELRCLEINTNGDRLTSDTILKLYNSGCSHITVSMYDRDRSDEYNQMKRDVPINMIYRHHYSAKNNYNLNIVNRSEMLTSNTTMYCKSPCHIPFYKMMIDWNGDVLLCNNDWSRTVVFGNINTSSVYDIWFGQHMNAHRSKLLSGRHLCSPCKGCSIDGLKRGRESVNNYIERYENKI